MIDDNNNDDGDDDDDVVFVDDIELVDDVTDAVVEAPDGNNIDGKYIDVVVVFDFVDFDGDVDGDFDDNVLLVVDCNLDDWCNMLFIR